jgi:hypothetical protein
MIKNEGFVYNPSNQQYLLGTTHINYIPNMCQTIID